MKCLCAFGNCCCFAAQAQAGEASSCELCLCMRLHFSLLSKAPHSARKRSLLPDMSFPVWWRHDLGWQGGGRLERSETFRPNAPEWCVKRCSAGGHADLCACLPKSAVLTFCATLKRFASVLPVHLHRAPPLFFVKREFYATSTPSFADASSRFASSASGSSSAHRGHGGRCTNHVHASCLA